MSKTTKDDAQVENHDTVTQREPETRSGPVTMHIPMPVDIILGRSKIPLSQLLGLSKGAVVELDRKLGDPVDITVNGMVIAYGKLVSIAEGKLGVEVTEVAQKHQSLQS